MQKIELLAPAGDLDKLKLACLYGADAIYIGGKEFSLRYFASNFTLDDIKDGVIFAHNLGKKVYVTVNMVMHNENLPGLEEYLKNLKNFGVDGVIASSLNVLNLCKKIDLPCHMSTQLSILNSEAANFFAEQGSPRVVLAREASLSQIKEICKNSKAEVEVFIHGGMCSSYSGKCLLSKIMCDRDPNRGGCAHSCRWEYHVCDSEKNEVNKDDYLSMSSKDLCALKEIPALIDAGVASLKIEGRMKSYNYLACIISAYRMCIDDYYAGKKLDFDKCFDIMQYGENRLTGHGFFYGNVTINESLLELSNSFDKAGDFVGIIRSYNAESKTALLEVKNKIIKNYEYLFISPGGNLRTIRINNIAFKGEEFAQYTIAGDLIEISVDEPLKPYDLLHVLSK